MILAHTNFDFSFEDKSQSIIATVHNTGELQLTLEEEEVNYLYIENIFSKKYSVDCLGVAFGVCREFKSSTTTNRYIATRAKKLAEVLAGKGAVFTRAIFNLSLEQCKILYKLRNRLQCDFDSIFKAKLTFTDSEFNYLLNDLQTLPSGFCQYLLDRLQNFGEPLLTFEQYEKLKQTSKAIKKCKYPIHPTNRTFVHNRHPKNRLQYFACKAFELHEIYIAGADITKLTHLDKNAWATFKDYSRCGRYSIAELRHLIITVNDGRCMYDHYKDNDYNIEFVEVKGSPNKLVQRAIYNHRQHQKLQKAQALTSPNINLPLPPLELPEWIENIRIKTSHELLNAGIECRHCIGSYTHSDDIFIRQEDICAQIRRDTLEVIQCFDTFDKITPESKKLKSVLTISLKQVIK